MGSSPWDDGRGGGGEEVWSITCANTRGMEKKARTHACITTTARVRRAGREKAKYGRSDDVGWQCFVVVVGAIYNNIYIYISYTYIYIMYICICEEVCVQIYVCACFRTKNYRNTQGAFFFQPTFAFFVLYFIGVIRKSYIIRL